MHTPRAQRPCTPHEGVQDAEAAAAVITLVARGTALSDISPTMSCPAAESPITSGSSTHAAFTGDNVNVPRVTATASKEREFVPARTHDDVKVTRSGFVWRSNEVHRHHQHPSTIDP
eukprot:scaffold207598_cov27-Tisochrysis_lutea.AAC.2